MPHYYSHKGTKEYGNISVIPNEWHRRFLCKKIYSPFVYKVNDVIKFRVKLDKFIVDQPPLPDKSIIYEKMGNGALVRVCVIDKTNITVEGKAGYSGDTKFFLATQPAMTRLDQIDETKSVELFFEDVKSLSSYVFGWVGIIITAIIAPLIVGVILWLLGGLVQLLPILRLVIE